MNRFVKLFFLFSLVGFLVTLLFVFSALPADVDVSLGSKVIPAIFLSRNSFFYIILSIVVVTNAVLLFLAKALTLFQPKQGDKEDDFFANENFKNNLTNWLGSFTAILNMFYSMGVLFVGLYNNPEYVSADSYRILAYVSVFLIVGWVFWLVIIVMKKNRTTEVE